MKKVVLAMLALCILLFGVCSISVFASGAELSCSKSTLRAGDSFSVTLKVSLTDALTVDGAFHYSGPLSLISVTGSTGTLDRNGDKIFVDLGNSEISGTKTVAVAKFQVNASAKPGETVSVSFSGNYSNLRGDYPVSGSVTKQVARPLSGNCNLKSLRVGNAVLSPGFTAECTVYSAGEVPFSVSSLDIQAVAEDSDARVTLSGNTLAVGENTVTVTVKAENGTEKVYTVRVVRQQDPNYIPSSNTALSGITVNGFLLSPPFDAGTDSYVIWLPYETESITVSASPADPGASVAVTGGANLREGDNTVLIICTAEDGTQKQYSILAKRAYREEAPQPTVSEPVTEPTEETVPPVAAEPAGIRVPVAVLLCVASFALGGLFVLAVFLGRKKKQ